MAFHVKPVCDPRTICVFCSSSDRIDAAHFDVAHELGIELAGRGHGLVYGGAGVGLMGEVARAVKSQGGRVTAIIPDSLVERERAFTAADELIVTATLRERKALMAERSQAFLTLPGGFGTLEETVEIMTLKLLGYHEKPIVLLNALGFWEPLLRLFDHMERERFAQPIARGMYYVAESVTEALDYIGSYQAPEPGTRWL
jgi:uncharacterized protein (TIGR00730 family)